MSTEITSQSLILVSDFCAYMNLCTEYKFIQSTFPFMKLFQNEQLE